MTQSTDSKNPSSSWAPFSERAFALLWTATLISNIGTWMHDVGAGWLMTMLAPSPAMVSLVQASTTLPIFLFALLAGALADRLDKKRMLLVINTLLVVIVASLTVLVELNKVTPGILLFYTLLIGTGAAFMAPAWQAIVPSLVPKAQLQSAIALNSMGINISRALGPALAGILISVIGITAPFALNAVSHLVIIAALLLWRVPLHQKERLPPEPIRSAMITGLRHAAYNPALLNTMKRAFGFFLFASAYWALLPLISNAIDNGGPQLYGILLGSIGFGAVIGALLLPALRKRIDHDRLVLLGTLGTSFVLIVYALADNIISVIGSSFIAGLSWIIVLTSLNVSAQTALPNWIRARGLAVYLMVFFGSMALGATTWGQVASFLSIQIALLLAGCLIVIAIPLTWRFKLGLGESFDLSSSTHWPNPTIAGEIDNKQNAGPVMVTILYTIHRKDEREFLIAIKELSKERYRDGAFQWGVYQDSENPENWIEWFLLADWSEHLRQHQRVTQHDKELQDKVKAFHQGSIPPLINHYLGRDH